MANFPLRMAIDVRSACVDTVTGKGQWTRGCVRALLSRSEIRMTLLTDRPVPLEWQSSDAEVVTFRRSGLRWHFSALRHLQSLQGAVYLSPSSYIIPAISSRRLSVVPVIHDLIAFQGESHDIMATIAERLTLGHALGKALTVLTASDATMADLLARYPALPRSRVTAVYAGPMEEHPALNAPDGKTIACIGTLCPRKNQLRLIRAFAALPCHIRDKLELVLAGGRGWHDDDAVRVAGEVSGVRWIGYINDAEYRRLLSTCFVFALPSLYEGFGMQILDALQRGCTVLTSDRGGLKEVAGDAAIIVDPDDISSITDGLVRACTDEGAQSTLREKAITRASAYSWSRTVDLLLSAILRAKDVV